MTARKKTLAQNLSKVCHTVRDQKLKDFDNAIDKRIRAARTALQRKARSLHKKAIKALKENAYAGVNCTEIEIVECEIKITNEHEQLMKAVSELLKEDGFDPTPMTYQVNASEDPEDGIAGYKLNLRVWL